MGIVYFGEYNSNAHQDDHHLPLPSPDHHRAPSFAPVLLSITPLLHHDHHLHSVVHRGRAEPELLLPSLLPFVVLVLPLLETTILAEGRE